jgi:hypothetical protein
MGTVKCTPEVGQMSLFLECTSLSPIMKQSTNRQPSIRGLEFRRISKVNRVTMSFFKEC